MAPVGTFSAFLFLFAFSETPRAALAFDVALTPPMGWNSWNYFACDGISAEVLMQIAQAINDTGLKEVGYQFVNSDDCWMLPQRNSEGQQVPDPSKFPNGFAPVTSFIHSLGLKSGLYTAKGTQTCDGNAASCDHEYIDAAQWAEWGIDYVKDDSCSACGNDTDDFLYGRMWQAINATGHPMVLTVEGNPNDWLITKGGYGNAKRVGHDIKAFWLAMISLIDIGSGLWPYAHNGSLTPGFGGWWNDLDMIEVGNAPDFVCGQDPASMLRCQTHMALWALLKSPLILGNDLRQIGSDPATFSVLASKEAIAVNQDPLGIQARRVSVQMPKNNTFGVSMFDNVAVIAKCDPTRKTQNWFLSFQPDNHNFLYVAPCNESDLYQQWSFGNGTLLKNEGSQLCVDAGAQITDPAPLLECNSELASQIWTLQESAHLQSDSGLCLDVDDYQGPDVLIHPCKVPGQQDSNQAFSFSNGMIYSLSNAFSSNSMCLTTVNPYGVGYTLMTIDESGIERCLQSIIGCEGGWAGVECSSNTHPELYTLNPIGTPPPVGAANYSLLGSNGSPQWNNQEGASGPWPHTRYVAGFPWTGPAGPYTLDLQDAQTSVGTTIMAGDHVGIYDDDLVGNVTQGGDFCLDLVTGGMLEVWAGPLSEGRIGLVLLNRSPGNDTIVASWADIGAAPIPYVVSDLWANDNLGTFSSEYVAQVPAHASVFLTLTPA